jgi:hypothetical protein
MARPDISQVNSTDTFQIWLNKTNEIVTILNNNALTASLGTGDTTIGNAILEGSFTANTVITSETRTQTLQHETTPTDAILSLSPISVESDVETVLSVKSTSSKPIVSLINQANLRWNIEHETSLSSSSILFKTAGAGTPQAILTQAGRLQATAFQGDGNLLTNLNPNNIGSGAIPSDNIADLDAGKITTGVLDAARIPNLDAGKITTGVLGVARIPNLDAGKITTGVLGVARIPNLDATKITTGILAVSRGGTGVDTFIPGRILFGSNTSIIGNSSNLFWDSANNRLGVNTETPTQALHVVGNALLTGSISAASVSGTMIATQADMTTGTNNTKVVTPLRAQQIVADLFIFKNIEYINASSVWTVPVGVTQVYAMAIGGGPGGGGGSFQTFQDRDSFSSIFVSGPTGGFPGVAAGVVSVTPNSNITITIGAGGSGSNTINVAGGNGGQTSFGSLLEATGGQGSGAAGIGTIGPIKGTVLESYSTLLVAPGLPRNKANEVLLLSAIPNNLINTLSLAPVQWNTSSAFRPGARGSARLNTSQSSSGGSSGAVIIFY